MLPQYQLDDQTLMLWQTKWKGELDPLLANPLLDGLLLEGLVLVNGLNTINHKLQRKQRGWFLVDTTEAVALWRPLPFNNLTLSLMCNGTPTVSLWCF